MTVVCYRPDPSPNMDTKLNFVEAFSSDGGRSSPEGLPVLLARLGLLDPLSREQLQSHITASSSKAAILLLSETL